jgi:hypothetical protein
LDYGRLESRWKLLFVNYLEGKGHVQSATLDMNSMALPANIDPAALRSFLFVQAVSASTYLPTVDSDDYLKVSLQSFIGDRIC